MDNNKLNIDETSLKWKIIKYTVFSCYYIDRAMLVAGGVVVSLGVPYMTYDAMKGFMEVLNKPEISNEHATDHTHDTSSLLLETSKVDNFEEDIPVIDCSGGQCSEVDSN